MKKTVLSGAAGLALSATMLSAYADIITANYNPLPSQVRLSDPVTASLQFSDAATGVINATKTDAITSADGASVIYTTKTNAVTQVESYRTIAVNMPLTSVSYDTSRGNALLNEQFGGSFTISNAAKTAATNGGGSLTISNLNIDFLMLTVTASITGANGVGQQDGVTLFTFDSPRDANVTAGLKALPPVLTPYPSPTPSNPDNPYYTPYPSYPVDPYYQNRPPMLTTSLDMSLVPVSIPALTFTLQGRAIWAQSLGYNNMGNLALQTVLSAGSFTSPAVPEAATLNMMGMGLVGMVLLGMRRKAQSARR